MEVEIRFKTEDVNSKEEIYKIIGDIRRLCNV